MMENNIYFIYVISFILLIISLLYLYKYFKMVNQEKKYIEVLGIVTYSNTILVRYTYKTFCNYKYEYLGNTYEAYDRGYGKNLKKINDQVKILINPNNPKKYLPPMKYSDRNRYLIFGIIYLISCISIILYLFK